MRKTHSAWQGGLQHFNRASACTDTRDIDIVWNLRPSVRLSVCLSDWQRCGIEPKPTRCT